MKILLTNDDGIESAGMQALMSSLPDWVEVMVVAPHQERSASSHSISLRQKLQVKKVSHVGTCEKYAVDGTPADCVKFALSELDHFHPNLVIAGINRGANTGVSVYYSGTVSAAREALINRIPGIAVSLCSAVSADFSASVNITRRLIEGYAIRLFPADVMLNVNLPPLPQEEIRGIKITRQAASRFVREFVSEQVEGRKLYQLVGEMELYNPDGTSDEEAVRDGFISITPLKLDLTDYSSMVLLHDWIRSPQMARDTPFGKQSPAQS